VATDSCQIKYCPRHHLSYITSLSLCIIYSRIIGNEISRYTCIPVKWTAQSFLPLLSVTRHFCAARQFLSFPQLLSLSLSVLSCSLLLYIHEINSRCLCLIAAPFPCRTSPLAVVSISYVFTSSVALSIWECCRLTA